MQTIADILSELRRRRVFRVAIVYAGVAFIIFQIVDATFEPLHLPDWAGTLVVVLLALGFPIAVGLAWAFDITEKGIVRTKGKPSAPTTPHHIVIGNKSLALIAVLAIIVAVWALLREPSPDSAPITSIAVLPLENLMNDPDQDYFVDGMTEALIADLSKIGALRVISRTSAMRFKDTDKSLPEIARELGVNAVAEGSVLRSEDKVRITVQLIGVEPERHLWAHSYERELRDILDLQREVARDIARKIHIAVTPEEESRMAYRPIENVQAYECYLRARYSIFQMTEDALDRAMEYLQRGQELLGENALLYASMAYVYWNYVNIGFKQEEYIDLAEEYAEKALELDAESAEGHNVLGLIYQAFSGNQKKAVYHFRRALAINPNDPDALFWLAVGYTVLGKTGEAYSLVDRLLEIDPLTQMNQGVLGLLYFMDGQFETALEIMEKFYQLEPQNPAGQWLFSYILAATQQLEEASALVDSFTQVDLNNAFTRMTFFLQAAIGGDTKKMEELLTPEFKKTMQRDPQFSWQMATFYALAGQKAKALDWLENAVDRGFINYPFLAEHDPFLAKYQGDERFQQLMQRVKYEWEHFDD